MTAYLLLLFFLAFPFKDLPFEEHTIATGLKGGYQVVPVDMNHDGKIDLIGLASGMTDLVWYENPTWEPHVIVSNLPRMINCAAWDTDGDGIPEIVLAYEFANVAKNSIGIVVLLQHDGDPRKPWKMREIDRIPTSHRLRWADIDGSGKKVLVNAPLTGAHAGPPDFREHVPLVYYRPGEWKRVEIGDQNEGVVHGITVVKWDKSKREQLLTASFVGIDLYSMGKNGAWSRTEISKGDPAAWPKGGSSDTAVGRTGKDRFIAAIEPWHGNQVAVYRQKGKAWEREVIDTTLVDGHTIVVGDFDGSGSDQIVAGFRGKPLQVYVYRYDEGAKKWTRGILDDGGMGAAACAVADLNGDGKLDIACIGSATQNLKWYENKR
jgi:hypothetical protein